MSGRSTRELNFEPKLENTLRGSSIWCENVRQLHARAEFQAQLAPKWKKNTYTKELNLSACCCESSINDSDDWTRMNRLIPVVLALKVIITIPEKSEDALLTMMMMMMMMVVMMIMISHKRRIMV